MSEQAQNALMVMEENHSFIVDLSAPRKTSYCTFVPKTEKDKANLFKAMNNPEKRIGDCINMTINAKDVFCEVVSCINRETGESNECPRIVIMDDKGVGYQAVSLGVFSALKKVFQVYGVPTWEKPIPLKVVQLTKGDRKILTFDIG